MIEENKTVFIYALLDPKNNEVRYIGWSGNAEKRLKQHLKEAKRGEKNHRCNWIRHLLSEDLQPILEIIEETTYKNRNEREKYWIAHYGRENLVNGTDGGEGKLGAIVSEKVRKYFSKLFTGNGNPFYGKHHTDETLEKLRSRNISNETREKISLSKKGKSNSQESKEKLKVTWKEKGHPFLGRNHTEESKEKNRQAHFGKTAWNKGLKTNLPSPRRGTKVIGTSKYFGVSKRGNGFCARVGDDSERIYLYGTQNEKNTAIAYDIGAIYYYGESCNLNFPNLREDYISYLQQYDISNIKELRQVIKNYISERS